MSNLLKIQANENPDLVAEMIQAIQAAGGKVQGPAIQTRSPVPVTDIILALGSAGVFTALYKIIREFLAKNRGEITLETQNVKLTLKGPYLLPDAIALLEILTPELSPEPDTAPKHVERKKK